MQCCWGSHTYTERHGSRRRTFWEDTWWVGIGTRDKSRGNLHPCMCMNFIYLLVVAKRQRSDFFFPEFINRVWTLHWNITINSKFVSYRGACKALWEKWMSCLTYGMDSGVFWEERTQPQTAGVQWEEQVYMWHRSAWLQPVTVGGSS